MNKVDIGSTDERIGAYRVVRTLATGDVSEVLLAKAEGPLGFERTVVLKLLLPEVQADEEANRLFAREAAAYARLSHPNVVRLYDFFALDAAQAKRVPGHPSRYAGQLVMVLEYVEGPTLQRLRRMLKTMGLVLSDAAAMHIAASVLEGLAAAHKALDDRRAPAPVIHRDVNPENILVSWSAQVKLADFGMAKVAGMNVQSIAGTIRGTHGYMAPEQVTGTGVTPRVDVYACAIVLWEMLAKRRAFAHSAYKNPVEMLRAMEQPTFAPLDEIRGELDKTFLDAMRRALEPNPERRRITAEELAAICRDVVSSDEGREKLARSLAQVRHEPRPTETMPPPNVVGAGASLPRRKMTPPVALPAVKAPPRPMTDPARRTAKGLAPPPVAMAPMADVDDRETLKPIASGLALPAKTDPPATDRADVDPGAKPSERQLRLGTPLEAMTPGKSLKEAIDDILDNPGRGLAPKTRSDERPRMGQLPPAPPPMHVSPHVHNAPTPPVPRSEHAVRAALDSVDDLEKAASGFIPDFVETVRPPPSHVSPDDDSVEGPSGTKVLPAPPVEAPPQTSRLGSAALPLAKTTIDERPRPPPVAARAPEPAPPPPVAEPLAYPSTTLAMEPPVREPAPPMLERAPISAAPPADEIFEVLPRRKRSSVGAFVAIFAVLVVAIGAGVFGTFAWVRYKEAHKQLPAAIATATAATAPATATATATATASATATATASATASVSATATASAAAPATTGEASATTGTLKTEGASPGRRIFVDEKTMGQTPESVTVKCGARQVKIGSSGVTRTVDVPCGGEITVH